MKVARSTMNPAADGPDADGGGLSDPYTPSAMSPSSPQSTPVAVMAPPPPPPAMKSGPKRGGSTPPQPRSSGIGLVLKKATVGGLALSAYESIKSGSIHDVVRNFGSGVNNSALDILKRNITPTASGYVNALQTQTPDESPELPQKGRDLHAAAVDLLH